MERLFERAAVDEREESNCEDVVDAGLIVVDGVFDSGGNLEVGLVLNGDEEPLSFGLVGFPVHEYALVHE